MAETLRVGILCDGLSFQHWQAECIRQVLEVKGVEPVVLIVQDKPAAAAVPLVQRMLRYPWRMALYLWWRKHRFHPPACASVDMHDRLSDVPRLSCRPSQQGYAQQFSQKDLDAIAQHRPDVLLRFGFNILKGAILTLPRHGVWSYHHGDEEKYRGQPPGFWEVMDDEPVTGAILQRLTEKLDAGLILRKGWFRTIEHSLEETLDTVLMGSAGWAALVCRELLMGRSNAFDGVVSSTTASIRKYPGNIDFINFLLKQSSNKRHFRRQRSRQREEWNIGVLYQPISSLLEPKPSLNVRWLPAPGHGQFRAAPFGYMVDGQMNVLYEKFDHTTGKGEINRLRPKRDNILKRSRAMLSTDAQCSYPFIVEKNGVPYVVPESVSKGRVDLFRVNAANDALEHVGTLLDEPLIDPTVFEHDGRWWMLGTKAPLSDVALYVYHAPALEGPYTAHALNPVKMDIRSSRSAGTPFTHQGHLYRPAQDGSRTQGWRVALMRVLDLSPTAFSEELVKTIGPLKGSAWSHGMHTLSAVGDLTLVDGKRYVPARASAQRPDKRSKDKKRDRTVRSEDNADDEDED